MSSWTAPVESLDPDVEAAHAGRAFERKATIVTVVALTLGFGACLGFWLSSRADEASAIRQIPETERRALHERTLQTLGSVCEPARRSAGLQRYCNEQARFVLEFPECDAECRALAVRARSLPTR